MRILATAWTPDFDSSVTTLDKSQLSRGVYVRRVLKESPEYDVCMLSGDTGAGDLYDDHVLAGLVGRRGQRVLLTSCIWEPGSRRITHSNGALGVDTLRCRPRIVQAIKRIIAARDHPNIHYTVVSTHEQRLFPSLWGISSDRVHFVPYFATSTLHGDMPTPLSSGPTVFCGGNSLRDYRPVLEAAPLIDGEIFIATQLPMPTVLPANVTARAVPPDEYDQLSRGARIHLIPLLETSVRSAGQQTYLNAMALGQPVIALRAPGIEDYIEHEHTGLVVERDPGAIAAGVNRLLDDRSIGKRLGMTARSAVAERFTLEHTARYAYAVALRTLSSSA
jgi:hypothetical protein